MTDCAAIARRRVSRHPGCEFDDLHQIAQIAAWRYPERVAGAAAKRDVLDYIRKQTHARNRHIIPHRALEWQERAEVDHAARLAVEQAMRILPVRLYWIVYAKFWLGMKQVEIARAIGVNEARVHQLLSDAMDRMRMEVAA